MPPQCSLHVFGCLKTDFAGRGPKSVRGEVNGSKLKKTWLASWAFQSLEVELMGRKIEILQLLHGCFWWLSFLWCSRGFLCFCNGDLTLCVQRTESRTTDQNHMASPKRHRWPYFTSAGFFLFLSFFNFSPEICMKNWSFKDWHWVKKTFFSQEKMSVKHVGTPSALDSKSDHIQMWN